MSSDQHSDAGPAGGPTPAKPSRRVGAERRPLPPAGAGGEEAIHRGRPRLGAEKGVRSPVVRGAIPQGEFEQFESLRSQTGRTQSELVREAIGLLLAQRGTARLGG